MENLIKYVNNKNKQLLNSNYTFEDLFNIIHDQGDHVFGEYIANYQVEKVTYKEMKNYILKMASFLEKRIKDEKDTFVGLYLENSIAWVACFWALILIGYKPALLNTRLPLDINNEIINTLNIKTIVGLNINNDLVNVINIEADNAFRKDVLECSEYSVVKSANEMAICSTATSLNYKICIYSGEDITYQVLNAKKIIKTNNMIKVHYQGSLKVLAFLPFYHIFGLVAAYLWFSIFGRTFVFLNDYSSDTILKTIKRHNVTHVFAVPLLWTTITKEIKKKINTLDEKEQIKISKWINRSIRLQNIYPKMTMKIAQRIFKEVVDQTLGNSIKFLITGGGYITDEALLMINALGYPLFNGYGSTEVGITSVELRKKGKYRISGSVGKPFASVDYKIDDGILYVKGQSICSKIISKEDGLITINKDQWYKTNDVASVDEKGNFYINGRMDDVFISTNGEKYNPDLIEQKCLLTTVDNYCIIKKDDKLVLIIQININANKLVKLNVKNEVTKVVNYLRDNNYPLHEVYYTTDNLMNKNAIKVSRTILNKLIDNGMIKLYPFDRICEDSDYNEEIIENDISLLVAKVFSEILGIDIKKEDYNKHFIFDLGGSSLDYITLLVKLKAEFDMDFNFGDSSFSNVNDFAKYIMNVNKIN